MKRVIILSLVFSLLGCITILFIFYQIFFIKNVKVNCFYDDKQNNACYVYKSTKYYIILNKVKEGKRFYIIDSKNKMVYFPNYHYFFVGENILFWKKGNLLGVPITSAAKIGEQDFIWTDSRLEFTNGENRNERIIIYWGEKPL